MSERVLVFIPTFNESRNIARMCGELRKLSFQPDVLFVDDNSPDGTGEILDGLAAADSKVFAIHRQGKQGLGTAHQTGIRWAYQQGYRKLITMDCDFTHKPADIPKFMALSEDYDFIISTRYGASDDTLQGWTLYRKFLTRTGKLLIRLLLGMKYDATTSFRLYRLDRIPMEIFDHVKSPGYAFFFESTYLMHLAGFNIQEIPVELPSRREGDSKMDFNEVKASLKRFIRMIWSRWTGEYRGSASAVKGMVPAWAARPRPGLKSE